MPHEEPSGADTHERHAGDRHEDGTMMEQPDDARLVTITAADFEFSPAEITAKPSEKLGMVGTLKVSGGDDSGHAH